MVMAQSLFISLKKQNPGVIIDVVSPEWSLPLLSRMPEINQAIALPVKHKQLALFTRYQVGKQLRKHQYDQAIVIPRSFKSALVPYFAGATRRTGYKGEMRYGLLNDIHPLDKSVLTQTVQRYVALGQNSDIESTPVIPEPRLRVDEQNMQNVLNKLGLKTDKPIIGIMPGAEYGPAKQWPYYKELAQKLVSLNYYVWVFGSEKDQHFGNDIVNGLEDNAINLCGKTSLVDAVDLIPVTEKVVSNDSGLMHIACATGTEVIAIYGSSTPDYTPPLSAKAKVLYRNLPCSPCFKRICPYGHTDCLKNIDTDSVLNAIGC